MPVKLHEDDCLAVLKTMPDQSIHSIVTDPPYGLSFMGRKWDYDVPTVAIWTEALRVLKPGGYLLSFSSTRTYHRMVVAIEDAGFEIRDQIGWLYGSGFPKSHDVSKSIDKMMGAERELVGWRPIAYPDSPSGYTSFSANSSNGNGSIWGQGEGDLGKGRPITAPVTDEARQWEGWGTALKPAWEPIVMARKPFRDSVAANVLAHGCGGLNVDACRVAAPNGLTKGGNCVGNSALPMNADAGIKEVRPRSEEHPSGRWPANVIHDGSDEVMEAFAAFGERSAGRFPKNTGGIGTESGIYGKAAGREQIERTLDAGTAARFFYCSKASKADRCGSRHPTVKPVALMRYLCRLVTPKGGTVLDPFAGSGTTGQAAVEEGFNAILIEREAEYCENIRHRLLMFMDDASTSLAPSVA